MRCNPVMTAGLFSFATTSSAFTTQASVADSPNEMVYLESAVFSMFILLLVFYFGNKATLTPMAMMAPSPSISKASNAIRPDTQSTNWRAPLFAARLLSAAMGR